MQGSYHSESKREFVLITYRAIRFHFQGSYDYFKYSGKLPKSSIIKDFVNSREYWFCNAIQRGRRRGDVVNLILSNILYKPDCWLDWISDEEGEEVYMRWRRYQDSLSYQFNSELKVLFSDPKHFNKYFAASSEGFPDVVHRALNGELSLETTIILNHILGFMESLNSEYKGDFLFDDFYKKMKAYTPFFLVYHNFSKQRFELFKRSVIGKANDNMNILTF
jgi:hypothetical protein